MTAKLDPESRASMEAVVHAARAAATEAAALALQGFRREMDVEHKGAVDLVTRFDRESEVLLRERLGAAFAVPIVGEEQGGRCPTEGPAFFIDPIDGTTNFVHGHPFWCVSIGLAIGGEPRLGVVVAPALGTEWFGWRVPSGEASATRRIVAHAMTTSKVDVFEPCRVSTTARFEDSLLATGFPYDRRTSPDNNFDAFVAIKRRCQAVRRCGSAALDLCLVADGTYEGYWERKLSPWDIAGGAAIVLAAGGRVTDYQDESGFLETGHLVATNGAIHAALLAELAAVVPASLRRSGR
jgi:myo-inositol-1(or 4)-monophosphatase